MRFVATEYFVVKIVTGFLALKATKGCIPKNFALCHETLKWLVYRSLAAVFRRMATAKGTEHE